MKNPKKDVTKPKYNTQKNIIQTYLNNHSDGTKRPVNLPFEVVGDMHVDESQFNSSTEVYSVNICHNTEEERYPVNRHTIASTLNFPRYDSSFPSANIFLYDDDGPVSAVVSNRVVNLSGIKNKLQVLNIILQLQMDFYRSDLLVPTFIPAKSMINTTLVFKLPFNILEERVSEIAAPGFASCFDFNSNKFSTSIISVQVCQNSNFPFSSQFPPSLIASQEDNTYSCRISQNTINMCGGSCPSLSALIAQMIKNAIRESPNARRIILPDIPRSDFVFQRIA